jgi:hypothetical protein
MRRPASGRPSVRLVKWAAPDAGYPSGSRYFTVPAALGNQYRENKKHEYDKTLSHPLPSAHRLAPPKFKKIEFYTTHIDFGICRGPEKRRSDTGVERQGLLLS